MVLRKGIGCLREPYKSVVNQLVKDLKKLFKNKLVSIMVVNGVDDLNMDLIIILRDFPTNRTLRLKVLSEVEKKVNSILDKFSDNDEYQLITITPIIKDLNEIREFIELYSDMILNAVIVYDKGNIIEKMLKEIKNSITSNIVEGFLGIEVEEMIAAGY